MKERGSWAPAAWKGWGGQLWRLGGWCKGMRLGGGAGVEGARFSESWLRLLR